MDSNNKHALKFPNMSSITGYIRKKNKTQYEYARTNDPFNYYRPIRVDLKNFVSSDEIKEKRLHSEIDADVSSPVTKFVGSKSSKIAVSETCRFEQPISRRYSNALQPLDLKIEHPFFTLNTSNFLHDENLLDIKEINTDVSEWKEINDAAPLSLDSPSSQGLIIEKNIGRVSCNNSIYSPGVSSNLQHNSQRILYNQCTYEALQNWEKDHLNYNDTMAKKIFANATITDEHDYTVELRGRPGRSIDISSGSSTDDQRKSVSFDKKFTYEFVNDHETNIQKEETNNTLKRSFNKGLNRLNIVPDKRKNKPDSDRISINSTDSAISEISARLSNLKQNIENRCSSATTEPTLTDYYFDKSEFLGNSIGYHGMASSPHNSFTSYDYVMRNEVTNASSSNNVSVFKRPFKAIRRYVGNAGRARSDLDLEALRWENEKLVCCQEDTLSVDKIYSENQNDSKENVNKLQTRSRDNKSMNSKFIHRDLQIERSVSFDDRKLSRRIERCDGKVSGIIKHYETMEKQKFDTVCIPSYLWQDDTDDLKSQEPNKNHSFNRERTKHLTLDLEHIYNPNVKQEADLLAKSCAIVSDDEEMKLQLSVTSEHSTDTEYTNPVHKYNDEINNFKGVRKYQPKNGVKYIEHVQQTDRRIRRPLIRKTRSFSSIHEHHSASCENANRNYPGNTSVIDEKKGFRQRMADKISTYSSTEEMYARYKSTVQNISDKGLDKLKKWSRESDESDSDDEASPTKPPRVFQGRRRYLQSNLDLESPVANKEFRRYSIVDSEYDYITGYGYDDHLHSANAQQNEKGEKNNQEMNPEFEGETNFVHWNDSENEFNSYVPNQSNFRCQVSKSCSFGENDQRLRVESVDQETSAFKNHMNRHIEFSNLETNEEELYSSPTNYLQSTFSFDQTHLSEKQSASHAEDTTSELPRRAEICEYINDSNVSCSDDFISQSTLLNDQTNNTFQINLTNSFNNVSENATTPTIYNAEAMEANTNTSKIHPLCIPDSDAETVVNANISISLNFENIGVSVHEPSDDTVVTVNKTTECYSEESNKIPVFQRKLSLNYPNSIYQLTRNRSNSVDQSLPGKRKPFVFNIPLSGKDGSNRVGSPLTAKRFAKMTLEARQETATQMVNSDQKILNEFFDNLMNENKHASNRTTNTNQKIVDTNKYNEHSLKLPTKNLEGNVLVNYSHSALNPDRISQGRISAKNVSIIEDVINRWRKIIIKDIPEHLTETSAQPKLSEVDESKTIVLTSDFTPNVTEMTNSITNNYILESKREVIPLRSITFDSSYYRDTDCFKNIPAIIVSTHHDLISHRTINNIQMHESDSLSPQYSISCKSLVNYVISTCSPSFRISTSIAQIQLPAPRILEDNDFDFEIWRQVIHNTDLVNEITGTKNLIPKSSRYDNNIGGSNSQTARLAIPSNYMECISSDSNCPIKSVLKISTNERPICNSNKLKWLIEDFSSVCLIDNDHICKDTVYEDSFIFNKPDLNSTPNVAHIYQSNKYLQIRNSFKENSLYKLYDNHGRKSTGEPDTPISSEACKRSITSSEINSSQTSKTTGSPDESSTTDEEDLNSSSLAFQRRYAMPPQNHMKSCCRVSTNPSAKVNNGEDYERTKQKKHKISGYSGDSEVDQVSWVKMFIGRLLLCGNYVPICLRL